MPDALGASPPPPPPPTDHAERGYYLDPRTDVGEVLPRNYWFGTASQFDHSFRGLADRIVHEALRSAVRVYARNMERVSSMTLLPIEVAYWTERMVHVACYGSFNLFRRPDVKLNGPDALKELDLREQLKAERQRLMDNFIERRRQVGSQEAANQAWRDGVNLIEDLCARVPWYLGEAIAGMLASLLTTAWTAVETLAGDLWVAALNACPSGLAELNGTPTRIEKHAGGRPSRESQDKASYRKEDEKIIVLTEVHRLTRGTYDMSKRMGDLLRGRFKFTTLSGIRAAYSVAFSEKEAKARADSLDAALADKSLDALAAVRNVIVHKAGVADADYAEAASFAPLAPKAEVGKPLELDGRIVQSLLDPVIRSCVSLVQAVDRWLTLVGGKHGGDRTTPSGTGNAV